MRLPVIALALFSACGSAMLVTGGKVDSGVVVGADGGVDGGVTAGGRAGGSAAGGAAGGSVTAGGRAGGAGGGSVSAGGSAAGGMASAGGASGGGSASAGGSVGGGAAAGGSAGCSVATCPTGCCLNGACEPGTSATACGGSGAACVSCSSGSLCTAQACAGSPTARWRLQATSAQLDSTKPGGGAWDFGSPPDAYVTYWCPVTVMSSTSESEVAYDTTSPTWSTGGCTMTEAELTSVGFSFDVFETDGVLGDEVVAPETVVIPTTNELASGTKVMGRIGGMASLTFTFTRM